MDRRRFLKVTGGMGGGMMAMGAFPTLNACGGRTAKDHYPFGIQLFTLRSDMAVDPFGVMERVASFGYRQIESYEGPSGMFWGKSPADLKGVMDDLDLDLVSSHCDIHQDFEEKAAQAASIGMRYLVCPHIGSQPTLHEYRRYADLFNECGEICRREGIRFAYHNHAYTFQPLDGVYPQDLLMQETDPALVDFQLDMYWVAVAGADLETWLRRYPGRFALVHVKDLAEDPTGEGRTRSCTLGTGVLDYKRLLPVAWETGTRYFIIEQEAYEGTTPMDSARDNAQYMRQFRFG